MSAEALRPLDGDTGATPEEAALGRVLESYLAGLEAGRAADPDRLIAAHPELAGAVRACLKVMHLAAGLGDASGQPARPFPADPGDAGITAPPGASASTRLWPRDGSSSHLLLPEPPEDDAPIVRISGEALPDSPDGGGAGRYQVLGEIARGGMGVVFRARDVDLGRDLALKVLQSRYRGDPDVVGRFVEEARIGGQLQHPGIVPVHELGTLADHRPYFTMKLVKGRTLAALLVDRPSPEADRTRFLSIFEQVCQTVAYAHARRVIHRDLKPANVMVGSFGEVQVVDWGLAKLLPEGGVADEAKAMAKEDTAILTSRSGPAGSGGESLPGSVMGTPSYMAPEQARGELDRIDERADVFGLGAILCEVLTSRPPFAGSTRDEIRAKATRGDLADALARLEASGADAELIGLARDCLAAEPERRPRNAGEVARRMSNYQGGVQDRLRAAELARVEAQTRAEEERKRRRVTVALATSLLGLVLLGGGGGAYLARQRAVRLMATTRVVTEALAEAERLRGQAQQSAGDLAKWSSALAAAQHASSLLDQGEADDSLRSRVTATLADLEREQAAAAKQVAEVERDRKLLGELEAIRASRSEHWDWKRTDREYAASFHRFGIEPHQLGPQEAGRRIARRSEPLEIASFLDQWAIVRGMVAGKEDEESFRALLRTAQTADPDPWRGTVRDLIGRNDRAALQRIADDQKALETQTASSLLLLAASLEVEDGSDRRERVLTQAWRLAPDDFWVNFELGMVSFRDSKEGKYLRPEEAGRFLSAAVALRPHSFAVHYCLGIALFQQGKREEGIAELRAALRINPGDANSHNNLGMALREQGKADEAIAEFRAALRFDPNHASAHVSLGAYLAEGGRLDEAVAEFRAALRSKPTHPVAHYNLGTSLLAQGKADEAIAEYRAALRLWPEYPDAHNAHTNLGIVLTDQGKLDEAVAEYRSAIRLKPDDPKAHAALGLALGDQGKLGEAVAEYRIAVRLKPDLAEAHYNLGNVLENQGKVDEAVAEYRIAVRLKPDLAEAHNNLGTALKGQGKVDEAIAEYRAALRLRPNYPEAHTNLGGALSDQGKLDEAIAEYRTALRIKPDHTSALINLGGALRHRGNLDEAIAACRAALRLKPDHALAHNNLGLALKDQGKLEEAVVAYRTALRLRPDFPEAHTNLGMALRAQGVYPEAVAALRKARDLAKATNPRLVQQIEPDLTATERFASWADRLPDILSGKAKPAGAAEMLGFAQLCYDKKLYRASARFWAEAFQSRSNLAEDLQAQHRYNAACAAALAGCGLGKDDPPLNVAARARWRKQAIDWLRSDLVSWSKILAGGPPQARPSIAQTLQHWKGDPDLAGLRDPGSLDKLPKDEQVPCRALWKEVDALLARAGGGAAR